MNLFFNDFKKFIFTLYADPRIPERDKKLFIFFGAILGLRLFLIPDWIPYFGPLDLLVLMGLMWDYVFNILDQNLVLSHYPWGMKSFARLKRIAQFFAFFAPTIFSDHLWLYTKDPF